MTKIYIDRLDRKLTVAPSSEEDEFALQISTVSGSPRMFIKKEDIFDVLKGIVDETKSRILLVKLPEEPVVEIRAGSVYINGNQESYRIQPAEHYDELAARNLQSIQNLADIYIKCVATSEFLRKQEKLKADISNLTKQELIQRVLDLEAAKGS